MQLLRQVWPSFDRHNKQMSAQRSIRLAPDHIETWSHFGYYTQAEAPVSDPSPSEVFSFQAFPKMTPLDVSTLLSANVEARLLDEYSTVEVSSCRFGEASAVEPSARAQSLAAPFHRAPNLPLHPRGAAFSTLPRRNLRNEASFFCQPDSPKVRQGRDGDDGYAFFVGNKLQGRSKAV